MILNLLPPLLIEGYRSLLLFLYIILLLCLEFHLYLIMANKPSEVLEILGEDVKVFSQDAELISMSFQLLGNINKASEITQICMYQHLG